MNFSEFGFSEPILKALSASGYETPTPVQEASIPWIMAGQDVLACAQTGTGKTASFTLPMIELLHGSRSRARMPRGLIITPTRELALQIQDAFQKYAKGTSLKTALLIGGTSMDEQNSQLERSVDVLIATPGRFLDHFGQGRLLLTDVKIFVIDEADRMLDMGFIPDLKRIVAALPPLRQTLMFSATMPSAIRDLAGTFLSRPKEVIVSPPAQTATNVTQRYIQIPGAKADVVAENKRQVIRLLLKRDAVDQAIIFCNRKSHIAELCRFLKRTGFDAHPLHGDLSQEQRFETLESFRAKRVPLLVASDVAGRGIDVESISHVFNFDVPTQADEYVHRIGRTGRAGRSGTAYTLVGPDDMKLFKNILDLIQKGIPEEVLSDAPFGGRASNGAGKKSEAPKTDVRTQETSEPKSRREARPKKARTAPIVDASLPEMDDVETLIAASVAAAAAPLPPLSESATPREGLRETQGSGRSRRRRRGGAKGEVDKTAEAHPAATQEALDTNPQKTAESASHKGHERSRPPARDGSKNKKSENSSVQSAAESEALRDTAALAASNTDVSTNGGRVRRQEETHKGTSKARPEYDRAKQGRNRPVKESHERAFVGFGDHVPAFMLR